MAAMLLSARVLTLWSPPGQPAEVEDDAVDRPRRGVTGHIGVAVQDDARKTGAPAFPDEGAGAFHRLGLDVEGEHLPRLPDEGGEKDGVVAAPGGRVDAEGARPHMGFDELVRHLKGAERS